MSAQEAIAEVWSFLLFPSLSEFLSLPPNPTHGPRTIAAPRGFRPRLALSLCPCTYPGPSARRCDPLCLVDPSPAAVTASVKPLLRRRVFADLGCVSRSSPKSLQSESSLSIAPRGKLRLPRLICLRPQSFTVTSFQTVGSVVPRTAWLGPISLPMCVTLPSDDLGRGPWLSHTVNSLALGISLFISVSLAPSVTPSTGRRLTVLAGSHKLRQATGLLRFHL